MYMVYMLKNNLKEEVIILGDFSDDKGGSGGRCSSGRCSRGLRRYRGVYI